MSFIVDASVAVKWFVIETHREKARALLLACGGDLEAPELLLTEVANVVWKKAVRREITPDMAKMSVEKLFQTVAAFYSTERLINRALEISIDLDHPVYDCLYLACAEATERVLITDDRRLVAAVADTVFAGRVELLSETVFADPDGDFH